MKVQVHSKAHISRLFLAVIALFASTLLGHAADVDPNTVGRWELAVNGGHWVWEIDSNGTYKFHSEAPDGVAPHVGTFSASGGVWSLQATNGYTDGGTYNFQPPGSLVVTGHLGTATWLHPASATISATDNTKGVNPPHLVNETSYLKMPDDHRQIYVIGVYDGLLFGYEAAKAGWNMDFIKQCLDSMTSGALRDATDKDAKNSAEMEFDGAPMSDDLGGASAAYSGLLTLCKH